MDIAFIIALSARYLVAVTFLVAGIQKLMSLSRFKGALSSSRLFRAPLLSIVLIVVPVCEVAIAVWLLLETTSVWPVVATLVLLAAFTGYVMTLRTLRRDASCGCFRSVGRISDPMVSRNVGLMCLVSGGLSDTMAYAFVVVGSMLLGYWAIAVARRGVDTSAARA